MFNRFKKILCCVYVLLISVALFSLSVHWAYAETASKGEAFLLDIDGAIGPATQDFIQRGIEKAERGNASVIILRLDTPGGLSSSMRGIIKAILSSSVPVIAYVAPSGARAASAGTYILYASHVAAMAPGTNLGAATPVSMGSPEKPTDQESHKTKQTPSELKALNDAKAYIRSLAQLHGRNVQWAEKAVTVASSLSAEEALKINVINYIANDIPALLKKANGMKVNVMDRPVTLNTDPLTIKQIQPDWRTKFLTVITNPSVAYILMMIGIYGIFFEFASPGLMAPGVIGAIAILIALYAFQLLPINYTGLALILLGVAFIVAEAFLPSFGVLGIGGVVSFLIGSIFLMKTEAIAYRLPIYLIVIITFVTVVFFLLVINLAWRSHRRPVVSGREALIGKHGIVYQRDKRVWIHINGERWQCKSEAALENGDEVVVVDLEGLICIVKPIERKP